MMTVHRRRKTRRFRRLRGPTSFPPSWLPLPPEALPTTGSAKPGRGGRRKRKAERARIRARIGQRVERKGWPLSWALRKWAIVKGPARPWTDNEIAALVQGPWFVLPAECELQILEPKIRGRRERRRRAKLRRRRARRRAGRTTIVAPPGLWRGLAKSWALDRMQRADLDRMAEMFDVKRTPGA